MDVNNNQTWKSDYEVICSGKSRSYQNGSVNVDKGRSHFLPLELKELSGKEKDGGRAGFETDLMLSRRKCEHDNTDDVMRGEKLQTTNCTEVLVKKEETKLKNDFEVCSEITHDISGHEDGFRTTFQKSGKDIIHEGLVQKDIKNRSTKRSVGNNITRMQKINKRKAVHNMIAQSANIKDNFEEHMVDLANQAEKDDWMNSNTPVDNTDNILSEFDIDDSKNDDSKNDDSEDVGLLIRTKRSSTECCLVDTENGGDDISKMPTADGILLRRRNYFREKSQSSNNLGNKTVSRDVMVPKVKMEKSAQIIEARPKSHHFLWTIPDPGSQKLNWHKTPLTVLVVKKIYDEAVLGPFKDLISWLIEVRKMIVFLESNVLEDVLLANDSTFIKYKSRLQTFREAKDDLTDKIDFIICLGGDGTLLHASTLFQQSCPPVMAFHQGSLGFLTPFSFDNFESQVEQVLDGNASLLLRYRLKCVICKEDSELGRVSRIKNIDSSSPCGRSQILVLNEVVIDRGSSSFICNIDVYVEGRLVTSVQGDGLIISTPTGSTAYAVAAGASMIHPNVPAIMITPICPHSLSFRPIVVPAGVELKIMLSPDARNSAMVSFDGRNRQEIRQGDSVRITTAQFPLPAVCAKDQIEDWFDRLAECLHWNVRKPQRSLDSSRNTSDSNISNNDVFHEEHGS